MQETKILRKFEIPYNFDTKLAEGLVIIDEHINESCDCIYMPPRGEDYPAVLRKDTTPNTYSKKEYEFHIKMIDKWIPNKRQLLLQRLHIILNKEQLKYYIDLGFTNYCVGTYEQGAILKDINPNFNIVGSILMNIGENPFKEEYKDVFDSFVLHFHYLRKFNKLKELPPDYKYIVLVNSKCNKNCDGFRHWNKDINNNNTKCPGIYPQDNNNWNNAVLVRPMDLSLFDPYISIYKLLDRAWPTSVILRDYILYTTDYSIYPGVQEDEKLYNGNVY